MSSKMVEVKGKLAESSTATQSDTSETTSPSNRPMSPPIQALWKKLCGNPFATTFDKWAKEIPDEEAVVWLNGEGDVAEIRTYKQLVDQIYELAGFLREIGIKQNDRLILCYPPGIDFIVAFYSCIISGIAAVPVYPPDPTKGMTDIPRFCDIGDGAGTKKALTSTTYRRVAAAMSVVSREKRWKEIEWICTDSIKKSSAPVARSHIALDPHSIAFLQVGTVYRDLPQCWRLGIAEQLYSGAIATQHRKATNACLTACCINAVVLLYACAVHFGEYI